VLKLFVPTHTSLEERISGRVAVGSYYYYYYYYGRRATNSEHHLAPSGWCLSSVLAYRLRLTIGRDYVRPSRRAVLVRLVRLVLVRLGRLGSLIQPVLYQLSKDSLNIPCFYSFPRYLMLIVRCSLVGKQFSTGDPGISECALIGLLAH